MFFGHYYCSIDGSKRIVIPRQFRTQIGDRDLGLLVNPDRGEIFVLPFSDVCPSGYVRATPDSRGRISLPTAFAEKCKKVMVAGDLDRFIIWTEEQWSEAETRFPNKPPNILKLFR